MRGSLKARQGKSAHDDPDVIEDNDEYLAGRLQERRGTALDGKRKRSREFENQMQ